VRGLVPRTNADRNASSSSSSSASTDPRLGDLGRRGAEVHADADHDVLEPVALDARLGQDPPALRPAIRRSFGHLQAARWSASSKQAAPSRAREQRE
jgi:hypothetical protein